jgi:uncharacterized protein
MAGEKYAEVLQGGFEAFGRGDMDYLKKNVFTDNTVWHVSGKSQLAGDYSGDQVYAWFGKLFELSGGTFKVEIHDIATSGDHAVALTSTSAERGGKKLENQKGAQVHHFDGGKISETWLHLEDPYEFDDFWS